MKIEFEIKIDDRLAALCRKVFRVKTIVFLVAAGLFAVGLFIFAGEFDTAYTFERNDVISSAEVNQNFRDLAERTLGSISDVYTSGAVSGNALVYNGVNWAPGPSDPTSCKWNDVTGGIGYSGGNVGIGITSPLNKLTIQAGAVTNYTGDLNDPVAIVGTGNVDTWINFWRNGTTERQGILWSETTRGDRGSLEMTANGDWSFNNGGNIGIGTTTPGADLDVEGFIQTGDNVPFSVKVYTGTLDANGEITINHGMGGAHLQFLHVDGWFKGNSAELMPLTLHAQGINGVTMMFTSGSSTYANRSYRVAVIYMRDYQTPW